MANILVTGGAGYIGSHAVHHLMDQGMTPIIIDNFSTGIRAAIPANITIYEGNVGDKPLMEKVFSNHQIDAVLHFAGSIVVPESVTNPGKYYANNTATTLSLLQSMVTAGVKHIVFSSTAAVYGNPDPSQIPVREDTPCKPINPYGSSKLMSEMMINDMVAVHDISAVILRYFNVAGADAKGRVGQSSPDATHLIKVAAEVLTGKRDGMQIFGRDYPTDDGTCIRDYIHVDDLIGAHLKAIDYLIKGGETLTLNCGYGRGFSVQDVVTAMNNLGEGTINPVMADRRDGDSAILIADNSACISKLNWAPQSDDLSIIVASALAWEKKQRNKA